MFIKKRRKETGGLGAWDWNEKKRKLKRRIK
jgi:hypothetical protein